MSTAAAATDPALVRSRLDGVRGLLLDLDGVIVLKGVAIPGAAAALDVLNSRRVPYQVVTNTSLASRRSIAAQGRRLGIDIPPERITSALSATAAWTRRTLPGEPLYLISSADARTEFEGQCLLAPGEADAPGARAAAVVIGDLPDEITFENLNRAFRLIRSGARLVGMHHNAWWLTAAGPTLDSGAFVAGLEFATKQRALILGKPSRAFFVEAARNLLAEVTAASGAASRDGGDPAPGGGRTGASAPGPASAPARAPARSALAMVGDDVWTDVLAAQRLGLRGVFVLTGKHGPAELDRAASQRRGGGRPDVVAASLAEVVAALD